MYVCHFLVFHSLKFAVINPIRYGGGTKQGVIFPAGVRVFPAGNLQNPQEILTKNLIIEQTL